MTVNSGCLQDRQVPLWPHAGWWLRTACCGVCTTNAARSPHPTRVKKWACGWHHASTRLARGRSSPSPAQALSCACLTQQAQKLSLLQLALLHVLGTCGASGLH